ncbi:unnamed protein product, partial [marine sediment metagenome]
LGRLERVELHEVWPTEAGDLTPWLARGENLALLAEAIGMDLEPEATENRVGAFRADLLCTDSATRRAVLIENQLGRSDHTHLGQVLTYAAGLEAAAVIWLADRFTDEHRAAIDWLNDVTDDAVGFFAVELEVWRIGDSPAAARFHVLCRPGGGEAGEARAPRAVGERERSETQQRQLAFWAVLAEQLRRRGGPVKAKKPLPQSKMTFAIGRTDFALGAAMNTLRSHLAVYLACKPPRGAAHFGLLQASKAEIEAEAGRPLRWRRSGGGKSGYICLYRR